MGEMERLVDVAQDLGPAGLAVVIDLAERLRQREGDDGVAGVRELLADPVQREALSNVAKCRRAPRFAASRGVGCSALDGGLKPRPVARSGRAGFGIAAPFG